MDQLAYQQHQLDPSAIIGGYQPIAAVNTVEHRYTVPFVSFTKDPATDTEYRDPGEIFVREVTCQIHERHFAFVQVYYQRAWFKLPEHTPRSQWPNYYFLGHVNFPAGYSEPSWPKMQRWIKQAVHALVNNALAGQPTCVMLDEEGNPLRQPTDDEMVQAYRMAEKATQPTARKIQAETVPLPASETALGPGQPVPAGLPPEVDLAEFQAKQQQEVVEKQMAAINEARAAGKEIRPSAEIRSSGHIGVPQAAGQPPQPEGQPQPPAVQVD